jgi:putative phage-type endonuclease
VPELIKTSSEAEWLEARRQGVTASEIAVLMGLSPWSSPYKLHHQKLGILPGDDLSAAMERGQVLEPYIAGRFRAAHQEYDVRGSGRELYAHSERPWQLATPDQLAFERQLCASCDAGLPMGCTCESELGSPVALAEYKTASSMDEWGEPGTDEIPVYYRAQVLWQMDVMGVLCVHVTVLDVPRWEIREYVIEHAPYCDIVTGQPAPGECDVCRDLEVMRTEALLFIDGVDREQPPDVDWRPATIGALKQLHPSVTDETAEIGTQLADRYEAAARNAKHWEQRKRLYEAQIREAAGSARRVVRAGPGQVPVARRDVYEVKAHQRKASTVDKLVLTPPKPKKES